MAIGQVRTSAIDMLQWSSCLFASVVIHAYHRQCTAYHHAFLLLTTTSILFHCEHHPVVRRIDKVLAHLVYALVLSDTSSVYALDALWLLAFPLSASCAWFAQSFWPEWSNRLHLALHLISVCGMHAYMCVLY